MYNEFRLSICYELTTDFIKFFVGDEFDLNYNIVLILVRDWSVTFEQKNLAERILKLGAYIVTKMPCVLDIPVNKD